jgi:hypothetical protein
MPAVRQAHRWGIVATALALAIVGVGCDDGDESSSGEPARSWRTFERLPPLPAHKSLDELALMDDSALSYGGVTYRSGVETVNRRAEIFRLGDRRWTRTQLPLRDPLYVPGAVWTGTRLVVVGQPCPGRFRTSSEDTSTIDCDPPLAAATFDPGANEWRRVAGPHDVSRALPGTTHTQAMGWTGRHALFWFRTNDTSGGLAALYDPEQDDWTTLPGSTEGQTICISGRSVLNVRLVSEPHPTPGVVGTPTTPRTWTVVTDRYELQREQWREIDRSSFTTSWEDFESYTECRGTEALIITRAHVGRTLPVRWFDARARVWEALPDLPRPLSFALAVRSGDTRAVWADDSSENYYVLEDGAAAWQLVSRPPGQWLTAEVSGDHLVIRSYDARPVIAVLDPIAWARRRA